MTLISKFIESDSQKQLQKELNEFLATLSDKVEIKKLYYSFQPFIYKELDNISTSIIGYKHCVMIFYKAEYE